MNGPFHEGELQVQRRAGVRDMAQKIGRGIHDTIPAVAAEFLQMQRLAIIGAADESGILWASPLTGPPAFLTVVDQRTLQVEAQPPRGDPLYASLRQGTEVGLIIIDFPTRQRLRVNGTVREASAGAFVIQTHQVFGNCPKYIQRRERVAPPEAGFVSARGGNVLDAAAQTLIRLADTFFIASVHPEAGVDVSHRGGNRGFVQVVGAATLRWPDYVGNTMFQTLGNLHVSSRAALLFLDFSTGATLQISGNARIRWEPELAAEFAGAQRVVELTVEHVVDIGTNRIGTWRFLDFSPHNPG